jgi:serine/threonine protein kinase
MGYGQGSRAALDLLRRTHPGLELRDCLDDPQWAPLGAEDRQRPVLSGRYRLGQLLGSGGMGRVYLATDLMTERQVAVKIFSAPAGSGGRDAFRLFLKEARTTGQLRHPHIVNLLDLSEESGYIVLEHMAGGTLVQRLRPRLDLPASRGVLLQLLSGLAAAHQRGIIHRDIKPSNIFFSAAGAAKLGDFGVAHLQDSGQTQTGAFIGTLAYMSPEQIRGNPVTFATDIYALGVTLFQMLTGQLPFTPPDLIGKHLTAAPPAPSSAVAELPRACDELVLRCLAKEPEKRFESLAALRQAIEQLPVDEKPPTISEAPQRTAHEVHQRRATDQRFALESTLHESEALVIDGALDNKLGRPVIVVRLAPGPHRQHLLDLLTAAASEGTEHLQRVLSLDAKRGQAVLQAPMGQQPDLPPRDQRTGLRLAEQLGLALAPLHRAGLAHGAVAVAAITTTGESCTLLLTEALITDAKATAADDVTAIVELLSLAAEPAPQDGDALAAWATAQRAQLEEARRNERYDSQLEEALATAPDGVDRT